MQELLAQKTMKRTIKDEFKKIEKKCKWKEQQDLYTDNCKLKEMGRKKVVCRFEICPFFNKKFEYKLGDKICKQRIRPRSSKKTIKDCNELLKKRGYRRTKAKKVKKSRETDFKEYQIWFMDTEPPKPVLNFNDCNEMYKFIKRKFL
jgi:hypothetical protein